MDDAQAKTTKSLKNWHRKIGDALPLKEFAKRAAEGTSSPDEPNHLQATAKGWLNRRGIRCP